MILLYNVTHRVIRKKCSVYDCLHEETGRMIPLFVFHESFNRRLMFICHSCSFRETKGETKASLSSFFSDHDHQVQETVDDVCFLSLSNESQDSRD